MRPLVTLSLGAAALAVALAAAACSSSSAAPGATSDAGSDDGGTVGAGGDAAADAPSNACGPAPYVTLGITVEQYGLDGGGIPLGGARFTSPLCPGAFDVSAADGTLTGLISKGAVFYGRFDANNFVSQLTPEQEYQADDDGVLVEMLPSLFTSLVNGYDPTKAAIFVGALLDTGHGACNALDGVQFSVVGHPEYVPTYYDDSAFPQAVTGATATTVSGRASFSPVDVGDPVTMMGTKPGCVVTFTYGPNTGRAPREAQYVTFIGAHVDDSADAGASDASGD